MLGELDGIARKVQKNLTQTNRIAEYKLRHVRPNFAAHIQAFLARRHRHQPHRILNPLAHVERNHVQVELARFNLGEVQNIVDHGQERVG